MFHKTIVVLIFSSCRLFPFAQNWTSLPQQIDLAPSGSRIGCLYNDGDSVLYIGGHFIRTEGGMTLSKIAKWDGSTFQPMGCGFNWDCADEETLNAYDGGVFSIVRYQNELYVAGYFQNSGTQNLSNVAKWNGSEFVPVGDGFDLWVNRLVVIEDTLYACGGFKFSGSVAINGLAKWNGSSWESVHSLPQFFPTSNNEVTCVAKYNDQLYVVGNFANSDLNIRDAVVWDGVSWNQFGGGFYGSLMSLGELGFYDDELIIAGSVSQEENPNNPGNGLIGWNGTSWNTFNNGVDDPNTDYIGAVFDMEIHENRIYVVGNFYAAGGVPANQLAFWEDDHWCTYVDTVQIAGSQTNISHVTIFQDTLYIAGFFNSISGDNSIHGIAKYTEGDECEVTGSTEVKPTANFSLFPNPTASLLYIENIEFERQFKVSIYDCIGQFVFDVENRTVIDVSSLSSGLYYVQIQDLHGIKAVPFIKN